MIKFICYPKCTTCQKAKKWLDDNKIDYENPTHILELLNHYVNLLKHCYEHPESNTRMLLFDLERLIEESDLSDVEQYILEQRVAHRNVFII